MQERKERLDATPLRGLLREVSERLASAGIEDARSEAWLLLAAATGRSRTELISGALPSLEGAQAARLEALVQRRLAREPMAYILGEKEFWSLSFTIGPAVLIPRPETETLVEAALDTVPDRRARLRVLDLGTGSGCILLALLAELPNATGLGTDISAAALAIARANARRLGLEARARFEESSWGAGLTGPFDRIVGNPPYVAEAEWPGLQPEVREFEPQTALLAGADGLDAYRALVPAVPRLLATDGALALEIGRGQGDAVAELLERHGLAITARRRDLAGILRCLVARQSA